MARSINRSKDHAGIIETLMKKSPDTGVQVFPTIKHLQCFAALLGFDQNRREKLDRSNIENIEWHTFENTKHEYYIYLIALAETKDIAILRQDIHNAESTVKGEDMVRIFEEYANGGFEIIRSWLDKNPSDPFGDKAILLAMEKLGFLKKEENEFAEVEF